MDSEKSRERRGPRARALLTATPVSRAAGSLIVAIAVLVLAAWATDMKAADALIPGFNRMNPMTAVALGLAGVALTLSRSTRPSPARLLKQALGGAVAIIGAAKLWALVFGLTPGIDLLIYPDRVAVFSRSLMAPTTAAALALLGGAIILSTFRSHKANVAAQGLATAFLVIAAAALLGYLYGAVAMYQFAGPAAMALHTAACLAAGAIGVFWTRPGLGLTGILTSPGLGGVTARRLLPTLAAVTIGLGLVRARLTHQGLLDEVTGVALVITLLFVSIGIAVLSVANKLRRVSQTLAARERALEETVRALAIARDAANDAARVKAEFMSNMSHEIRTPLTAIVGYADRLARRTDLDEGAHRQVLRIDSAAEALLSIVNDVLDFSRLEAGEVLIKTAPADPALLVGDATALFEEQAGTKGLELECRIEGRLPDHVLIDANRVRQVLLNLIGNAIKFTDQGHVRVTVAHDARTGRLKVDVKDTGPGLSEAQQDSLFRRFSQVDGSSTRRFGGTGLGLAISKGLIEAMGGDIGLRSIVGEGSTFYFSIPAPVVPADIPETPEPDDARLRGARILVVDDDAINRDLVRSILTPLGVELSEAADGERGVAAAAAGAFDAILMDIRMPDLDGFAAASRIRQGAAASRTAPIIAFSATVTPTAPEEWGFTFDAAIGKPFTGRDIIATIARCLGPRADDAGETRS